MNHRKILFFVSEDWYFWSHRLPIARAARDSGYEVVVVTRVNGLGTRIRSEGFRLVPFGLRRETWNPFREVRTVAKLIRLYRRERPDLVHHVALKPILYGSMAALAVRTCRVVNALAGFGYLATSSRRRTRGLRWIVGKFYAMFFRRKGSIVIVQNDEDRALVQQGMKVPPAQVRLIAGSGVDVEAFRPARQPQDRPLVLMAGRMLWNKGVAEFVEAAEKLKRRGVSARFVLAGRADRGSPAAIPESQLHAWEAAGLVEWWGHRDDMPEVFGQSTLVCLPSYREGVPKVLLEAAACGLPLITTDVPGCRDVVRHGFNGLLIPPRDSGALADAVQRLLDDPALRDRMGAASRELAVSRFSIGPIISATLGIYRELLASD